MNQLPLVAEEPDQKRRTASDRPLVNTPRTRIGRPFRDNKYLGAVSTVAILALGLAIWWVGSTLEWWSPITMPRPGDVVSSLVEAVQTQQFWDDTKRTTFEVGVSFAIGAGVGLTLGVVFWKWQIIGRVFEPYLVSFYAVPMVLFYPVMIVVVGINRWSVVILASIMAMIPMALNSWVGLSALRPVYLKLARSIGASKRQTFFEIALPGAAPYIMAGLRMSAVYALIGSVAMEFVTASAGLGFRVRYLYEAFDGASMYAYVGVIMAGSLLLTLLLAVVDNRFMSWRND